MRIRITNVHPHIKINIDGIDSLITKTSCFIGIDEDTRVPRIKMGGLVEGKNEVFKFAFSEVVAPEEMESVEQLIDTVEGYIADAPVIPGPAMATEAYVDAKVAALVDSAPGTLNTLNELAEAFNDNPDIIDNILTSLAAVPTIEDIDNEIETQVASGNFNGSFTDLLSSTNFQALDCDIQGEMIIDSIVSINSVTPFDGDVVIPTVGTLHFINGLLVTVTPPE